MPNMSKLNALRTVRGAFPAGTPAEPVSETSSCAAGKPDAGNGPTANAKLPHHHLTDLALLRTQTDHKAKRC